MSDFLDDELTNACTRWTNEQWTKKDKEERLKNIRKLIWTTKEGIKIEFGKIKTEHLKAIINMLEKKYRVLGYLKEELNSRKKEDL